MSDTPETDGVLSDGYTFNRKDLRPVIDFCRNLERQRNALLAALLAEEAWRNERDQSKAEDIYIDARRLREHALAMCNEIPKP